MKANQQINWLSAEDNRNPPYATVCENGILFIAAGSIIGYDEAEAFCFDTPQQYF